METRRKLDRRPVRFHQEEGFPPTALARFDDPMPHNDSTMHGVLWVDYDPVTLEVRGWQRLAKEEGTDRSARRFLRDWALDLLDNTPRPLPSIIVERVRPADWLLRLNDAALRAGDTLLLRLISIYKELPCPQDGDYLRAAYDRLFAENSAE